MNKATLLEGSPPDLIDELPFRAADQIAALADGRKVKTLIILGSGLADVADIVEDSVTIRYSDVPGFPDPRAPGHIGEIVMGKIHGHAVAVLKGKVFSHEQTGLRSMLAPIRAFRLLGAEMLLYSASTGSLNVAQDVGSLVLVDDHINLMGGTPLQGRNDDRFGPHFPDMANPYDGQLMAILEQCAHELSIPLVRGVYAAVLGPSFETPAEVRMLKQFGASVVGQSLVPDVIVARHCGMKVAAIANNTNLAVGISQIPVDHEQTLRGAAIAKQALTRLIPAFLKLT